MTHQLSIQSHFGKIVNRFIQKINYRFIQRFSACWVPDYKGNVNLAGKLSHPEQMPSIPVSYIGRLSRINEYLPAGSPGTLLIILSGPEPQRSIFEKIVFRELKNFRGQVTLVRGLPREEKAPPVISRNIVVYNYLSSPRLAVQIEQAETIISRSGYSTVMDIIGKNRQCIFVPTPGQPEQIYLADYLQEKGACIRFHQNNFSLEEALQKAKAFPFAPMDNVPPEMYKEELKAFVWKLKSGIKP